MLFIQKKKTKKWKKRKEKSDMRENPKKDIKAFYENLACATKAQVLELYFVYRARLYSLIWCIGSQFIMIIMVIIFLTFERNKEGIRNRGKRGCCRKKICDSANGKNTKKS